MTQIHQPADLRAGRWEPITCAEADALRDHSNLTVGASHTDLDGTRGPAPYIYTEWINRATETPVLREQRFPRRDGGRPDARPCQHDRWVAS